MYRSTSNPVNPCADARMAHGTYAGAMADNQAAGDQDLQRRQAKAVRWTSVAGSTALFGLMMYGAVSYMPQQSPLAMAATAIALGLAMAGMGWHLAHRRWDTPDGPPGTTSTTKPRPDPGPPPHRGARRPARPARRVDDPRRVQFPAGPGQQISVRRESRPTLTMTGLPRPANPWTTLIHRAYPPPSCTALTASRTTESTR